MPTHLCGNKLCAGAPSDPDFADLPQVPKLERTLDRLNGIYGSHTHFAVWSTEYGFRTRPPDPREGVSQANQALYMNEAEYLSYKQSRLVELLPVRADRPAATGVVRHRAAEPQREPQARASTPYRMPLWLPNTSTRKGRKLEVWGDVRPASYAKLDTGKAQSVLVQFQPGPKGAFTTIETVAITSARGYFDVHLAFPSSGR